MEAQRAGQIRSLGVSNYGVHHLNELEAYMKEVGGTLDVGQWELHPWLQREDVVNWCQERGVVVQAYCPLVRAQRADEEILKKLAGKHGKTWAQILVRWSLQKVSVEMALPTDRPGAETSPGIRSTAKECHACQNRRKCQRLRL